LPKTNKNTKTENFMQNNGKLLHVFFKNITISLVKIFNNNRKEEIYMGNPEIAPAAITCWACLVCATCVPNITTQATALTGLNA
jgi:hypothetical protein